MSYRDFENLQFEYKPKYKIFRNLMKHRIKEILLVSSPYDHFILEEDGRLSDQIYAEFHELNLSSLPNITCVDSTKEALELISSNIFDLVVVMRQIFDKTLNEFAHKAKEIQKIPVILLLTSLSGLKYAQINPMDDGIDLIFFWNGNSDIFVSLTKLFEDRMNLEYDTREGLVRVIIIVEDSIRFYSIYLPLIYSEVMRQVQLLVAEGVNDYYRLLQLKARPKIILAHTYEEAFSIYEKYKDYVIGIISDIQFPHKKSMDDKAGIKLLSKIRKNAPTIPAILQSSEMENKELASSINVHFIHKQSKKLLEEIRNYMIRDMGFGNFIFRDEDGKKVGKAENLREFKEILKEIPADSLYYHAKNDNFSGWLMARGEFQIASILKLKHIDDFSDIEELREYLIFSVEKILNRRKNIVSDFRKDNFDSNSNFIRIGSGSLGGKGRGLAFLMFLVNSENFNEFDINIAIPQTIVIGTNEYDKFIEKNQLLDRSLSEDIEDSELHKIFKSGKLSKSLKDSLYYILGKWGNSPIVVRSSSVVEDSKFHSFAGIFSTFMIANQEKSLENRLKQIYQAIKLVYSSTFSKKAKNYSKLINQRIEEIKMAVIIQKVVGKVYQSSNNFYPNFSGVARSFNHYPVGNMKNEDGIGFLALGLGRTILEGGNSRRFCPQKPNLNNYSSIGDLVNNSQTKFYSIDLKKDNIEIVDEKSYLNHLTIIDAIKDNSIYNIADTYNINNKTLENGYWNDGKGSPVISFNRFLKYDKTFPLPQIIQKILDIGMKSLGSHVEIEFAADLSTNSKNKHSIYLLQIRPNIEIPAVEFKKFQNINKKDIFAYSTIFSGNKIDNKIKDIVYVKPDSFDKLRTLEMVEEIDILNKKLENANKKYLLIVFGRLGTSDRHLGIPVKNYNITGASTIIETTKENFQIDNSQGTHFFQNMINLQIGYFYIKHGSKTDFIDWDWIKNQKMVQDLNYCRHIDFNSPLTVILDGKRKIAAIKKPIK